MNSASEHTAGEHPKNRHRFRWIFLALLGIVVAFPWILAKTTLRDKMLNAIVNSDDIEVRSTDASFGYVAPLSLSGLQIQSKDQNTNIQVKEISADHSWLGLLLARPELGTFRFESPRVDVLIKKPPQANPSNEDNDTTTKPPPKAMELPVLAAEIRDAGVTVRTPDSENPPIDIQGVDVTLRVEREGGIPVLRIDPTTLFDRQAITPELCGQGLQLVAPLLADEIAAQGEFSLRLNEFELPVSQESDPSTIHIQGELELHSASVSLKNTLANNVVGLVFQLLSQALPDRMTVAKGVIVQFEVVDGRIHHKGLALLLPSGDSSIEIVSNGSVGIDETLDLQVSVRLPKGLLGDNALSLKLSDEPILVSIGGTLKNPEVKMPNMGNTGGVIQAIGGFLGDDDDDDDDDDEPGLDRKQIEGAVTDIVGGLLNMAKDRGERGKQSETEDESDARQKDVENRDDTETKGLRSLLPRLRNGDSDRPLFRRRANDRTEESAPTPVPPAPAPPKSPEPNAPKPEPPQPQPI